MIVSNPSLGSLKVSQEQSRKGIYSTAFREMYSSSIVSDKNGKSSYRIRITHLQIRTRFTLGLTEFRMISMESDFLQQIVCIRRDQSSVGWLGAQLHLVSMIRRRANRSNNSIKPLCLIGSFSSRSQYPLTSNAYNADLCPSCITL